MSTSVDPDILAQFLSITGTEEPYAVELLKSHNEDLEQTLASHFAIQEAGGAVTTTNNTSNNNNTNTNTEVINVDTRANMDIDRLNDNAFIDVDADELGEYANTTTIEEQRRILEQATNGTSAAVNHDDIRPPMNTITERIVDEDGYGFYRRNNNNNNNNNNNTNNQNSQQQSTVDPLVAPLASTSASASGSGSGSGSGSQNNLDVAAQAFQTWSQVDAANRRDAFNLPTTGLAAIFRPPVGIMFSGTFDQAMAQAVEKKKWLLVNIQSSTEFASHTLNRDFWGDDVVQALIETSFVLWQTYAEYPEGQRFRQFYRFNNLPHIALIDPRSGERLMTWGDKKSNVHHFSASSFPVEKHIFIFDLSDFVDSHSLENDLGPLHHRRNHAQANNVRDVPGPSNTETMDEDAILAAAISESIEQAKQSGFPLPVSSQEISRQQEYFNKFAAARNDPVLSEAQAIRREQDEEYRLSLAIDQSKEAARLDSEKRERQRVEEEARQISELNAFKASKAALVPPEPQVAGSQQVCRIAIRLPSGDRIERLFLADNKIEDVKNYVQSQTGLRDDAPFDLMSPYPKKSFTDLNMTLKEAGLYPKAALIVHEH